MFRIAICDDDINFREKLYATVKEVGQSLPEKLIIQVFSDGLELYEAMDEHKMFDLIFLDIQMNLMNGILLSEKIRTEFENDLTEICFISAEKDFAMDLFDFRPLQFLLKPIQFSKIEEVIKKALRLRNKGEGTFEFKAGPTVHRLSIKDIMYFEGKGRKLVLHSKQNTYEFYSKLSDVKERLVNFDFIQIHKSFLVNYEHIKSLSYEHVELYDSTNLSISQTFRAEVRALQLGREK